MKFNLFPKIESLIIFTGLSLACVEAQAQVPLISSFTPTSGPLGTKVTISGTNFNPVVASNIVTFGAVQGTVVSATVTQLDVVVPPGAVSSPVSVTVSGAVASSASQFSVTFPSIQTIDKDSLGAQVFLSTRANPRGSAIVDVDGDGKPDLIVVNGYSDSISIYRNVSTNGSVSAESFAAPVDFLVGSRPWRMAVGDFNGDGKPDIAVANPGENTVSVFQNISTPGTISTDSLATRIDVVVGEGPWQVVVGDVDGDGRLDLVTCNNTDNSVSVVRNVTTEGKLAFASKVDFAVGSRPAGVALGDIDGDEKLDIAVANDGSGSLSLLRNTSSSNGISTNSFAPNVEYSVGSRPLYVRIGDLDGDGKPDVAVCQYGGGVVSLFRNTCQIGEIGSNSLGAKIDLYVGGSVHEVAAVDLDGDAKPELVASSENANKLAVFRNLGQGALSSGSFAPAIDFATGATPCGLSIGDLNNDGKPDIALVNFYGNSVSLFENTVGSPNPVIQSQPADEVVGLGTNAVIDVVASGQQPLAFQWYFNSTALSGETNSSIFRNGAQSSDSGDYYVVVTNSFGSITSRTATLSVLIPPAITAEPVAKDAVAGADVVFEVVATGSAPIAYQWTLNGLAIAGATNATMTVTNAQRSDAGAYAVRVTNPVGVAISSDANLSIKSLPIISQQPQSQSVMAGGTVSFRVGIDSLLPVVSSGTVKLWLKADAGVVADESGKVSQWKDQSGNANDAFQANAAQQPVLTSSSAFADRKVIHFDGIQDPSVGDYLQGMNDVGLGNDYTSFLIYRLANGGNTEQISALIGVPMDYYRVRAYYIRGLEMAFSAWGNDYGTGFAIPTNTARIWTDRMNSNNTQIELFDYSAGGSTSYTDATSYVWQPGAGYYVGGLGWQTRNFEGDIAELIYFRGSLSETDRAAVEQYLKAKYFQGGATENIAYQWQCNGTNILNATNAALTLSNVVVADGGAYTVIVTGTAGSVVSSNAVLTVNVPVSITGQPQSQAALAGSSVTLNVAASGTGPMSYQWMCDGALIAGATNASFTLNDLKPTNSGAYSVIVSNSFGSVTSSNAQVTVVAAILQGGNVTGTGGGTVVVPVQLVALGAENAISFSLNFDPAVLTFADVSLGSGASAAQLLSNSSQTGNGKLGVLLALPADATFAAGTQELVVVTFNIAPLTHTVVTPVSFGDSPVSQYVVDKNAQKLSFTTLAGSVAVAQAEYEGDVSPRSEVDHTVFITDWVQIGRFVAGLDTVSSPSEFQRADCAPRSKLGNGKLTITDWVQAGRYAAGLDPLTPVGGPTGPVQEVASLRASSSVTTGSTRSLSLSALQGSGTVKSVYLQLAAQGSENAIGASLLYDPTVLRFVKATVANGAIGATLNVNTNGASKGQLGLALCLPSGASFSTGLQQPVRVDFAPVSYLPKTTAVKIGNGPVALELSDVSANVLPIAYTDSTFDVDGLPRPALTITTTATNLIVSWPISAYDFVLQSGSVTGTNWTQVSGVPTTNGSMINLTLPASAGNQIFRLKQQQP